MKLLALDTSTDRLCVALCGHGGVQTHEEPGGPQASQRLLPAAQALLARHGLVWADLDGLAYGQGPGAFTGLRVACAAVQGLALGLGLRAVGVCSLMIVAEDARQQAMGRGSLRAEQACTVAVAVDARMDQVYDKRLRWDGQHWQSLSEAAVRLPNEVVMDWTQRWATDGRQQGEPWVLAGSGLGLMPSKPWSHLQAQALCCLPDTADRGAALGRCADAAWAGGPHLDAAQVMPCYVRDRVALTTAERLGGVSRLSAETAPATGGST
jgi:tRNA threonylcarbamoyladenosine biosynthesis protein TsaB